MIGILGDLHGDFAVLRDKVAQAKNRGATAVIQVGDFGYYPEYLPLLNSIELPLPVYWVDGNHECHDLFLDNPDTVTRDNCFFVPRGSVLTIDNRTIAFMGGASSIDKLIRLRNDWHWSPFENIREKDIQKLRANLAKVNNVVDMFITHIPPQSVIAKNFNPMDMWTYFRVDPSWVDPDAQIIETLWNELNNVPLYCGHMHREVQDRSCRIVDINEIIYV